MQQKTPPICKGNLPSPYGNTPLTAIWNRLIHVIAGKKPTDYKRRLTTWHNQNSCLATNNPQKKGNSQSSPPVIRANRIFGYTNIVNVENQPLATWDVTRAQLSQWCLKKTYDIPRFNKPFFLEKVTKASVLALFISSAKCTIALLSASKTGYRLIMIHAILVGLIKGCSKWLTYKILRDEDPHRSAIKGLAIDTTAEIIIAALVIVTKNKMGQRTKTGLKGAIKHFFSNLFYSRMNLDLPWSELRSCLSEFLKGGFKAIMREIFQEILQAIIFMLIIKTVTASILVAALGAFVGSIVAVGFINIFIDSCEMDIKYYLLK